MSHLIYYQDAEALGPVQRDEAMMLNGIIKTTHPKTLLEIGFFIGHSAFNFLSAMDKDAKLYSVDMSELSARMGRVFSRFDKRFCFIHKSQTDIEPDDFDGRRIDFLFIDASHNTELNSITFKKVKSHLSENAIIAIHDTGLWRRELMTDEQFHYIETRQDNRWLDETRCAHQPGERGFVNWIVDEYPEYQSVHLHSINHLRHGITLLQKKRHLKIPEAILKSNKTPS